MEKRHAIEILKTLGLEKAWAVYVAPTTLWTGERIKELVGKMLEVGELEEGEIELLVRLTGRVAWPAGVLA